MKLPDNIIIIIIGIIIIIIIACHSRSIHPFWTISSVKYFYDVCFAYKWMIWQMKKKLMWSVQLIFRLSRFYYLISHNEYFPLLQWYPYHRRFLFFHFQCMLFGCWFSVHIPFSSFREKVEKKRQIESARGEWIEKNGIRIHCLKLLIDVGHSIKNTKIIKSP